MIPDAVPAVAFHGVTKAYGATVVLEGIDLAVMPGEHLAICGPSGSGKSTLIRCISRLEPFQQGRIELLGRDLARIPESEVPEVGMVFQQFNLFPHLTVTRNCALALERVLRMPRAQATELAEQYLGLVHMLDHRNKYPSQLSGGQQQRVAIARSLCLRPKVMLFDEPTSALDPEMVAEVLEVMSALAASGMTMICVTHEMAFARAAADRVAFMDQGRILVIDSADAFFERPAHPRAQQFLARMPGAREVPLAA